MTCRRREIQGLARRGRSGVIGVTKLADILKTPVEKYVVCRRQPSGGYGANGGRAELKLGSSNDMPSIP